MCKYAETKDYIRQNNLKYHVVTYGCQMNEHESEKIAGMLENLGYGLAENIDDADFIIFNTCTVRENAQRRTFGNVGALKQRKLENKKLLVAVCGCMTQQKEVAQELHRTFPFVDIILGTHNLAQLPDLVAARIRDGKKLLDVSADDTSIAEGMPIVRREKPLASVNIMYGCNNYCSYCVVPYVRGRERSRDAGNIIREVAALAEDGYKEVMLLGQNVNSYSGGGIDFPALLQRICDETDISRIRFMTSHPKDLSDRLIDTIASREQVCNHIHLPVQSGSTRILGAMNRKYTREQYLGVIKKLREAVEDITVTTDFIVGFPGETEEDFQQTLSLAREAGLDAAYTFVYSPRTGTRAAGLDGRIAEDVARRRILELIGLQNEITEQKNAQCAGKTFRVLAQGVSPRDARHICGRTEGNKMVNFAGNPEMIGNFYDVLITEGKKTTLFGEIVR